MAISELVKISLKTPHSNWWYVAPTYRQAKSIAWRMLLEIYFNLPEELRGDKNESELWIEIGMGSRITLKGADNEDSLRGVKLNGVVIDEVASVRNWHALWEEVLRPSLTDLHGTVLFISTPAGFNHFYELYNKEQTDSDYKSWKFTSYDNPLIDPKEIDKAKLELPDDTFAQEYLADFRKQTGLIYKEFDRAIHIKPAELSFSWQFFRTMDFGAVNPTVCLWIAIDSADNIYVFQEYYNNGETAAFHANVINAMTSPEYTILTTWGDPSAQQEIIDYGAQNLIISPAIKVFDGREQNWVNSGIEKVRQYLRPNPQTGRPKLYIDPKCVNLIREFESYHWHENKISGIIKDMPDKIDDHALDALRYFFSSYSYQPINYDYVPKQIHNEFTGY